MPTEGRSTERSETVAREVAQEIAQIIAQNISQLIAQSTAKGISQETKQEEVGMGERYRVESGDRSSLMFANDKAAMDAHIRSILQTEQDNRAFIESVRRDSQVHANAMHVLEALAVKGGVATDALVTKQAIAHRDIAVDSTWVPGPGEEKPEEKAK